MIVVIQASNPPGLRCRPDPQGNAHENVHAACAPEAGRLGLTDAKGQPRCASVRPPTIVWTAEPAA